MGNEWEERARATKAYHIAHILRLAEATEESYRLADPAFKQYVIDKLNERRPGLSKFGMPSDQTWQMAVDLLVEMRRDDYLAT